MSSPTPMESEIRSVAAIAMPTEVEIAALAYRLWKDRGCPLGSPDEDWFLAETELMKDRNVSAAAV